MLLPAGHIPELNRSVAASRGQEAPVRTKDHRIDGVGAVEQRCTDGLAGCHVPEPGGAVPRRLAMSGQQEPAARAEDKTANGSGMAYLPPCTVTAAVTGGTPTGLYCSIARVVV